MNRLPLEYWLMFGFGAIAAGFIAYAWADVLEVL